MSQLLEASITNLYTSGRESPCTCRLSSFCFCFLVLFWFCLVFFLVGSAHDAVVIGDQSSRCRQRAWFCAALFFTPDSACLHAEHWQ
jgi:hypothetical protein